MAFKDIFNSISSRFLPSGNPVENNPYIALDREIVRLKSKVLDLNRQTESLSKKDIASWRSAWQAAINIEEPRRAPLYGIYTDTVIDNHLSGCMTQRTNRTLQKPFKITGKNGKVSERAQKCLEQEWFSEFCKLSLDSIFWGHSLIEIDGVADQGTDNIRFTGLTLVPRSHVIPEYGVVIREAGDSPADGTNYRTGEIAAWCIEVGQSHNLGLLLKAAPQCISKKNMLAYWDVFGEMFGIPLRIGTTTSQSEADWAKIANTLKTMGAAGYALLPGDSSIQVVESSKGDAFNVFDKRVDRCNSEISKLILGQTMTIDNGSSQSQSETHLEILEKICRSDALMLRNFINNRLLPVMVKHGFPVADTVFEWDEALNFTPTEQLEIERLLLQNYEVDPAYFSEKYNIPVTGKKQINLALNHPDFFA